MRCRSLLFCLLIAVLPGSAETKKTGFTVPAWYEGGTLPLKQHKIRATLEEDELILVHGSERVSVPLKNITAASCGTDVRRRFGASVLGMVPLMHLDKAETYYVGLTWTEGAARGGRTAKAEAVFKLSSGDYRDFLAALERYTHSKAVDTGKVPRVVRYEL